MKKHFDDPYAMSDEMIVELYWKRDEQAIKETDLKYKSYLLTIAYNVVGDAHDSEECLNDTYIGAWNSIPPTRPKLLSAFLATIMRRKAIDCYKLKTRQKRISSEMTVALSEVEDIISHDDGISTDTAELGQILSDFVRSLTERKMFIFMSRYYSAHPIKAIAKRLSCSESTVHKELAAIRNELKDKLKSEGYIV